MAKRLRILPREQTGLGLATIMDRELATLHGVPYVHLAVFAIDIDRVYALDPEREDLPFGWEVFLTEYQLLAHFDPPTPTDSALLAAMCAGVLEATPGEAQLGAQIVFAVFHAVQRGRLPSELGKVFVTWKRPPEALAQSLEQLWAAPEESAKRFATHCLAAPLTPALAPPTRAALERMTAT